MATLLCTKAAVAGETLVIHAGDVARDQTLVEFDLPKEAIANSATDGQGRTYPVQKSGSRGWVLVPTIKGDMKLILGRGNAPSEGVKLERTGKKLKASAGGKTLLEYQAEPGEFPRTDIKPSFRRGGYIHPIYSLSGKVITDDFPPNHIHHHGVWFAWSNAEFEGRPTDFWNMGDGKGLVEFVSVANEWSGVAHGGFTAKHRYVDLTSGAPKTAIEEDWEVRILNRFPDQKFWVFDLVSTQRCTSTALKFPEYRYGGIGLRGNWAWNGKDAVQFLTSDGVTDREKSHTMRARWCDMHGTIDGQHVGITVMGHPENFRAPQPMRVHPTEPFFNFAPQQAGEFEMQPGKPYIACYRLVIHEGPPDKAQLDRIWAAYATPPKAEVR
ncbi:MAG TPA: PmoA family protein [Verrucomicrobiae bacterium]|nr:PmoA family protein [Verrucomicrobiae bacterium]